MFEASCSATARTRTAPTVGTVRVRSEEHTSELQSRQYLVCRLLLEKKKESPSSRIRKEVARRLPIAGEPAVDALAGRERQAPERIVALARIVSRACVATICPGGRLG